MKRNLCFFVVGILLIINSSAQGVTTDSIAILDSLRSAGIRVQIKYVPKPKPKSASNEFYSIHLGAFISEIPISYTPLDNAIFGDAKNVYHIINEEGIYVYLSGEFKELNGAILEKNKLKKEEGNNIYVVKVIDKRKVVIIE